MSAVHVPMAAGVTEHPLFARWAAPLDAYRIDRPGWQEDRDEDLSVGDLRTHARLATRPNLGRDSRGPPEVRCVTDSKRQDVCTA
jgi:hypothetical protein